MGKERKRYEEGKRDGWNRVNWERGEGVEETEFPKEGLLTSQVREYSDAETPVGHPRGWTSCRSPSCLLSR